MQAGSIFFVTDFNFIGIPPNSTYCFFSYTTAQKWGQIHLTGARLKVALRLYSNKILLVSASHLKTLFFFCPTHRKNSLAKKPVR